MATAGFSSDYAKQLWYNCAEFVKRNILFCLYGINCGPVVQSAHLMCGLPWLNPSGTTVIHSKQYTWHQYNWWQKSVYGIVK